MTTESDYEDAVELMIRGLPATDVVFDFQDLRDLVWIGIRSLETDPRYWAYLREQKMEQVGFFCCNYVGEEICEGPQVDSAMHERCIHSVYVRRRHD